MRKFLTNALRTRHEGHMQRVKRMHCKNIRLLKIFYGTGNLRIYYVSITIKIYLTNLIT